MENKLITALLILLLVDISMNVYLNFFRNKAHVEGTERLDRSDLVEIKDRIQRIDSSISVIKKETFSSAKNYEKIKEDIDTIENSGFPKLPDFRFTDSPLFAHIP